MTDGGEGEDFSYHVPVAIEVLNGKANDIWAHNLSSFALVSLS